MSRKKTEPIDEVVDIEQADLKAGAIKDVAMRATLKRAGFIGANHEVARP
ncbi:MAG: hypothetical protein WCC90_20680 [Methylocella sp.]|jgi:hypothetical protein